MWRFFAGKKTMSDEMQRESQQLMSLLRSKWPPDFDGNSVIDVPVIYINMEKSVERRRHITSEFFQLRLFPPPFRLEAVDGAKYLQLPQLEPWIHPDLHSLHLQLVNEGSVSAGELGCLLSHIKAMYHAYRSRATATLILEDDIDFSCIGLWGESLSSLVQRTPSDWNYIQLYRGMDICIKDFTPSMTYPRRLLKKQEGVSCWGTVAYLVSRKALQLLTDIFFVEGRLSAKYFYYSKSRKLEFLADRLLYEILVPNNIYMEEVSRFLPNNFQEDLNSTIHTDHTAVHNQDSISIMKKYVQLANLSA